MNPYHLLSVPIDS